MRSGGAHSPAGALPVGCWHRAGSLPEGPQVGHLRHQPLGAREVGVGVDLGRERVTQLRELDEMRPRGSIVEGAEFVLQLSQGRLQPLDGSSLARPQACLLYTSRCV